MSILAGLTLLAVDTETMGLRPGDGHRIVSVAHVAIVNGEVGASWSSLVNPERPIPADATRIHGITDAMVAAAPRYAAVGPQLRSACADLPLVFHNAPFDLPFLINLFREAGAPPLLNPIVDTLGLARGLNKGGKNDLDSLVERFHLPARSRNEHGKIEHGALEDSHLTAQLLLLLSEQWERERGIHSLVELAAASQDVMRTTARR